MVSGTILGLGINGEVKYYINQWSVFCDIRSYELLKV